MSGVGDFIYNIFGDYGDVGVLFGVFLIFLIDALIFPALPEVFFILGYDYCPTFDHGLLLILMAVIAELVGIFTLYYVVKHIRVPAKIEKIVDKYTDFLFVSDEKIFLVNRVAPMIPFAGAFIAIVDRWDPKKCAFYIVIGCVLKYGAILMATSFFYEFFGGDTALKVTILFVIVVIALSFVASYFKKKKAGLDN